MFLYFPKINPDAFHLKNEFNTSSFFLWRWQSSTEKRTVWGLSLSCHVTYPGLYMYFKDLLLSLARTGVIDHKHKSNTLFSECANQN